jgi:hypothetical protein
LVDGLLIAPAIRIPLGLRKTLASDDSVHVAQCLTECFPARLLVLFERFFLIKQPESKVATAWGASSLGTEAKLKHSSPLSGNALDLRKPAFRQHQVTLTGC